jgi:predicted GNAT superfamily acetyltransferase
MAAGAPQPLEVVTEQAGDVVIDTPADIELLRKSNKAEAQLWRTRQRASFEEAMSNGYSVRGLNTEYSYVLSRG